MKHGQSVDVNRDIVGLAGANFAAGLSGTFVVNGSPTKTQILDSQNGRTQVANLTMSAIVLLVALFFTTALTDMPKAVLGAIVFLIGLDLIDIAGLRRIARRRRSEFVIAVLTAVVVCAVGIEQGIVLAIVVSIIEVIRRQYEPRDFVLAVSDDRPAELPGGGIRQPDRTRADRLPLRRAAVLRQREPLRRRRPEPDRQRTRPGPVAHP